MPARDIDSESRRVLTRRDFLWLTSLSAAGFLAGCAANPVTGRSQLMLMSESEEIAIDKRHSPHQISTDYGRLQDQRLNQYIARVGRKMSPLTHRPQMPYNFQGVNATYVNAYAFPGGSIAVTRGILLKLKNEAELSALLGHELGHVNARHTAEQMSKGRLTQLLVGGLAAYAGRSGSAYGELATQLGTLGAGALLASYSRDNEREADALGMQYLVKSGYSADGMVGLMTILRDLSKSRTGAASLLFATHPMSDERYQTAVTAVNTDYRTARSQPVYRDRYMDQTARLRAIKGAVTAMQAGEKNLGQKKYAAAETDFNRALKIAPRDYAALMLMAKCQLIQKKYPQAQRYTGRAINAYPQEAQAYYLDAFAGIRNGRYEDALAKLQLYDRRLPGNPTITFYKGLAHENMQQRREAADLYYEYIRATGSNSQDSKARYARQKLVEWGYIR